MVLESRLSIFVMCSSILSIDCSLLLIQEGKSFLHNLALLKLKSGKIVCKGGTLPPGQAGFKPLVLLSSLAWSVATDVRRKKIIYLFTKFIRQLTHLQ